MGERASDEDQNRIMISHDLGVCPLVDNVLVMENGKLVDQVKQELSY